MPRYDVRFAADCELDIVSPPTATDCGLELDDGNSAIVIANPGSSAYAVEGSLEELRAFADRLSALLAAPPAQE